MSAIVSLQPLSLSHSRAAFGTEPSFGSNSFLSKNEFTRPSAIRSNPTISWIVEVLLLNITFSGFEISMPSDIQPSANHKFVDILSNGKVNLSSNPLDEIELIQRGLDIKSVEKFRLELRWDIQSFAKAIGTNTRIFERHKKEHKRLNATLSENTFELAHLASTCIDYFENIERWNKWLNTCSLQFSSKTPLTFVNTIAGRRLIRNVVNSLKHGYNA